MVSPIPFHAPMTYLHVRLRDGEAWTFHPPAGHDVAWLAISEGSLRIGDATVGREMVVFEDGADPIAVSAVGETELVLGSAVKHPHPLVLGTYSVHTSTDALGRGLDGIRKLAAEGKHV
jgi:redox-sensitive bicupin YhaK (pirin superfamily)